MTYSFPTNEQLTSTLRAENVGQHDVTTFLLADDVGAIERVRNALAFQVGHWREAHRLAAEAERCLYDAAMMHEWGQGPKPPAAQRDATTRLRAAERVLFEHATCTFGPSSRR